MFLVKLNDSEKLSFLQIAHLAAGSDGVMDQAEIELLTQFAWEMGISDFQFEPMQANLSAFTGVFEREFSKRIVYVEIYGLLVSDGTFSAVESDLLQQLAIEFQFTEAQCQEMRDWVAKLSEVYSEGFQLIG
jgi:DnaJ-domain-containing protein 1